MFHFRVYVSATIALRRDTAGLKLRDKEEENEKGKSCLGFAIFLRNNPKRIFDLPPCLFQKFLSYPYQTKRMMMGGTRIVVLILAMMAVDRAKHTHEN
jgi:hypothetical protein